MQAPTATGGLQERRSSLLRLSPAQPNALTSQRYSKAAFAGYVADPDDHCWEIAAWKINDKGLVTFGL